MTRAFIARAAVALVLTLLVAIGVSRAQLMMLGAGGGGMGGGGVPFSISWQDLKTDTTANTTVTYTAANFGAADPNRVIAVPIFYRGSTSASVSSVTIGGVTATQVTGAQSGSTSINAFTDIWYATGVSGTSGNIVVTYSAAQARSAVEVYRIITSTPTPSSGAGTNIGSQTTVTQAITVPTGGGAIALVTNNGTTGTTTVSFTNATKDASSQFINLGSSSAGASAIVTGTGSVSVTGSVDGSANVMDISLAAWKP